MTQQDPQRRRVGDILTPLYVTLQEKSNAGVLGAYNLTGKTLKFKMTNAATGVVKVAESTTGVTVETAASGTAYKTFLAADVDTAGIFNCAFVAYDGSASNHFPAALRDLQLYIDSWTETAEEAYEAAL